jgi:hypothetical protein
VIDLLVDRLPLLYNASDPELRNVWPGLEQPVGGLVREAASFVRVFAERSRIHSDGQWRELDVQILRRFARQEAHIRHNGGAYAQALEDARATYDSLQLLGAFTGGVSAAAYFDVRAIAAPQFVDPCYFSLNFTFWLNA